MSTSEIIYSDPSAGLSLVSTRDPNLNRVRYLFTPGQYLDPDRVSQVEHIRNMGGGEEVQSHCLRRTVGGLIPRARLTPLEEWAEALPPELIGEGSERDTVVIASANYEPAPEGGVSRKPGFMIGKSLRWVKYYPGDEIASIRRAQDGKGIVEIPALMGKPWYADAAETEPGEPQVLNMDFFPIAPPIELSKIENRIEQVSTRSELHRSVARSMKGACVQFRAWAEKALGVEHGLLRQRQSKNGDFTYSYSPIARDLLRQLEMNPQDAILEQSMGGISAEQLQKILEGMGPQGQQMDPAVIGQIAGEVARQFLAAQMSQTAQAESDQRTAAEKRADTIARKKAEAELGNDQSNVGGSSD